MSTTPAPIAEVISQGGRSGSVETADAGFRLEFAAPSEKNPSGLTPEHLFGAAWAACYHGALRYVAEQRKQPVKGSTVTARVQRNTAGNAPHPLSVELRVTLPGIDEDEAQQVIRQAHDMCTYTKLTRGNVDLKTTLN